MIYKVYLDGVSIHNMSEGLELIKGSISTELNGAGSCDITMPYNHLYYDLPQLMTSEIDIYEDEKLIWFGRVTDIKIDWNNNKQISAEGGLAYFNDSILRSPSPLSNNGIWQDVTAAQFFTDIITAHNSCVGLSRQFTVRYIDSRVGDKIVTRTVSYQKTFDVLQEQILKALGGYIILEREYSEVTEKYTNYISWYKEIPWNGSQPVQFALNLLDLNQAFSGGNLITGIIPLGDDGNGGKVTISSVNPQGTGDYIVNQEAAALYGKILEVVEFNDISDSTKLLSEAQDYLEKKQFNALTIECSVAELQYLNPETEAFELGQNIHVYSTPHVIDTTLAISKMSFDITSASKQVTIGTPAKQDLTEVTGASGSTSATSISGSPSSSGGGGGGGGSTVIVHPIVETGEDLATITVDGRINTIRYDLPKATDQTLGGITVGDHMEVQNGRLSAVMPSINSVQLNTNKTSSDLGIIIDVTQEEYDALTTEEKNDARKAYYIRNDETVQPVEGNTILYGTTFPTSIQGNDGDIYMKYIPNICVCSVYAKMNGSWLPWSPYGEYIWDFTKSLVAINNGAAVTLYNGAIRDSEGLKILGNNRYGRLPVEIFQTGYTYEMHIASMDVHDSGLNNCVLSFRIEGNGQNSGFIWHGNEHCWGVWDPINLWQDSDLTDPNLFDNSVLKIRIDNQGLWKIYKDDELIFETTKVVSLNLSYAAIGTTTNNYSCYNMTVTQFKVYPN